MTMKVDIRHANGRRAKTPEVFQELLTAIQNLFTPEHPTIGFCVFATKVDSGQSIQLFTGGMCNSAYMPGLNAILNGAFDELRMTNQGIKGFTAHKVSRERFEEICTKVYEAQLAQGDRPDLTNSTH
jgi:hypothetical protein